MRPIVITQPGIASSHSALMAEAEALAALAAAGAVVHIRKPEASEVQLEEFLTALAGVVGASGGAAASAAASAADMSRFTLHYNIPLAVRFGLGGVHVRRDELAGLGGSERGGERGEYGEYGRGSERGGGEMPALRVSVSTHSWDEALEAAKLADYVFLSPVFDSISKPGYRSAVSLSEAPAKLATMGTGDRDGGERENGRSGGCTDRADGRESSERSGGAAKIVALGGIDATNIGSVCHAGFGGAALLGAVWSGGAAVANYQACRKAWDVAQCHLQFISDGDMDIARQVLDGGGRWIQLRMKDASAEEIAARGREMLSLCGRFDAVMLINDNPRIAAEIGADGVHLGKNDMAPAEARRLLGPEAIIGSTANTLEDVVALGKEPIDYIGLGPYRFTTTKKNLSPVLGLDGYRHIVEGMRARGITLPVAAIGGICAGDIPEIMRTGVYGIAVSGGIAGADDVAAETRRFLERIVNK